MTQSKIGSTHYQNHALEHHVCVISLAVHATYMTIIYILLPITSQKSIHV